MKQDTPHRVAVTIIRSMCDDPKVAELVHVYDKSKPELKRITYKEVFPQQVGEMLNWLTGTQRIVVDFPDPLTKGTDTVKVFRNALYKLIEDLYHGGLAGFLEAFPYED